MSRRLTARFSVSVFYRHNQVIMLYNRSLSEIVLNGYNYYKIENRK